MGEEKIKKSWSNLTWERLSAWQGGSVTALASSPNFATDHRVLIGTLAGIFQSVDSGCHWQRASQGMSDPQISTLIFVPATAGEPLTAFAATHRGHLYGTQITNDDNVFIWQPVTGWAGYGIISALAISPDYQRDRTLFAATDDGIFRSQDGGMNWESSTFGLLDLDILCLACAPNYGESELLWAGSAEGGLYRSRNGGRSWRDSGDGLPDSAVQCLLVSPTYAEDQTLFVGTESDGIYLSTDGAATWQVLTSDLQSRNINSMMRSADGQWWVAGTDEGLFYSQSGGLQWREAQIVATADEDPAGRIVALALAMTTDSQLLAGSYMDGILCSDDQGASWSLSNAGLAAHVPPVTAVNADQQLFALDSDGLFATFIEDANHWQPINEHLNGEAITAVGMPSLFDVTKDGGQLFVATSTALFRQSEADNEWHTMPLPPDVADVALLTLSPAFVEDQTLLVGDSQGTVHRSVDGGQGWQQLPTPWQESVLLQLVCSPFYQRDQLLYAVTAAMLTPDDASGAFNLTVWQGHVGGNSWEALADLQSESAAIAINLPLDPVEQPLLLAMQNRFVRLYQIPTEPSPETPTTLQQPTYQWQVTQQFLPPTVRITNIATTTNYIEDRTIYLTTTNGIYVGQNNNYTTNDGDIIWQSAWPEVADETIVALHCTHYGKPLYVVALGGSLWRTPQSD